MGSDLIIQENLLNCLGNIYADLGPEMVQIMNFDFIKLLLQKLRLKRRILNEEILFFLSDLMKEERLKQEILEKSDLVVVLIQLLKFQKGELMEKLAIEMLF